MASEVVKIVVLDGDRLNPGDNPWTEVERYGQVTVYDWTDPAESCDEKPVKLV